MNNKFLIVANWKMSLGLEDSIRLASVVKNKYGEELKKSEIILCPAFTNINSVASVLEGSSIRYGAQNVFWEESGPFTGSISPIMLKELGCEYVIVGHSERRINFTETDEKVNKKIKVCLRYGLIPIICFGEEYEDRKAGREKKVIAEHIKNLLTGVKIEEYNKLVMAYEPIWAISTMKKQDETPEDAGEQIAFVRELLAELYGEKLARNNFQTIYGGSVESGNVLSFARQPNICGTLVGAQSQKEETFIPLLDEINKLEKKCF